MQKMEIRDRQLEIITAAGEILGELGVTGLTTKRLAEKMGFAEAALYRHFRNKEDIIITLLNYLAANMEERLQSAIQGISDPAEQLAEIFNNQFDFFRQHPQFLVAIFSDGLLEASQGINSAIQQIMMVKRKWLLRIIADGQKQAVFRTDIPAEDLAHVIMGTFRLQMLQWRMGGYTFDLRVKGKKLMRSIFKLIQSPPIP